MFGFTLKKYYLHHSAEHLKKFFSQNITTTTVINLS